MARQVKGQLKGAQGKVGDVTYYSMNGQTYARTATTEQTNPQTESQMTRRVRLANVVAMYRASSAWARKSFQSKDRTQSDYNKFVQQNFSTSLVALTKEEVELGACVVAPYIITRGALPSIRTYALGSRWATDIKIGSLDIGLSTKVKDLTQVILRYNPTIQEGDQISFISYQQGENAVTGVPYVTCAAYELTLSLSDLRAVRTFLPEFCSQTVANGATNYLGTGLNLTEGGFAYILSRNTRRGLEVSTQSIIMVGTQVYNRYISAAHTTSAMQSYGLSTDTFLNPDTTEDAQDPGADVSIVALNFGLPSASRNYVTEDPSATLNESHRVRSHFNEGRIIGIKVNSSITLQGCALLTWNNITYDSLDVQPDAANSAENGWVYYFNMPVSVTTSNEYMRKLTFNLSDGTSLVIAGWPNGDTD